MTTSDDTPTFVQVGSQPDQSGVLRFQFADGVHGIPARWVEFYGGIDRFLQLFGDTLACNYAEFATMTAQLDTKETVRAVQATLIQNHLATLHNH
ncbi:MAG: hypothetical protein HXX20_02190 [Chloroflexi bacterium]|nr:hypothetical protein [Chloroflexota bacterium]